jgi:3-isopropylmalate/(R)-2-methylmalate dehydratase small subunit
MTDEFTIPEKQIKCIKSTVIPKPGDDQNTEKIVPGRFLKEVTFANMGDYAFFDERYKDMDEKNPVEGHPFNDPRYAGARILVANGAGFGSGSSREHAAQAIKRYGTGKGYEAGLQAVLAVSFAEIFAKNCQNIGVVCATASPEALAELTEGVIAAPAVQVCIDLENMVVGINNLAGSSYDISMPEGRRKAFMSGTWDSLAVIKQFEGNIPAVEESLPYLRFR